MYLFSITNAIFVLIYLGCTFSRQLPDGVREKALSLIYVKYVTHIPKWCNLSKINLYQEGTKTFTRKWGTFWFLQTTRFFIRNFSIFVTSENKKKEKDALILNLRLFWLISRCQKFFFLINMIAILMMPVKFVAPDNINLKHM